MSSEQGGTGPESGEGSAPSVGSDSAPAERTTKPDAPSAIFGVPIAAFVRGGTTSYASDMEMAKSKADADRRRAIADRERAIAATPIEEGGGMLYTKELTDNPSAPQAFVKLKYFSRHKREVVYECLCEVMIGIDPLLPQELTLQLVCPVCVKRGVPQGDAQLRIRQSNRKWHLDMRTAGTMEVFEETLPDGSVVPRPFQSAGMVMESDRFSCGRCEWAARIDKNCVHSE